MSLPHQVGRELAAEQILRKGNGAEPESLDPHRAESVSASNILRDLLEGLTLEAADGSIIPGVAERWDVSADSLTYTFHLRPSVRWSSGDPVTAHDFEFGLRRSCDPATLNEYASILYPILNAEAVITGKAPVTALGVRALDAADGFALLDLDDAVRLRDAGVRKPILLLEGFFAASDLGPIAAHSHTTSFEPCARGRFSPRRTLLRFRLSGKAMARTRPATAGWRNGPSSSHSLRSYSFSSAGSLRSFLRML